VIKKLRKRLCKNVCPSTVLFLPAKSTMVVLFNDSATTDWRFFLDLVSEAFSSTKEKPASCKKQTRSNLTLLTET